MTWDILYDQRPLSSIGMTKTASLGYAAAAYAIPAGLGAMGASSAQGMLQRAGADERTVAAADVGMGTGAVGAIGRDIGYSMLGATAGALGGGLMGRVLGGPAGVHGGMLTGGLGGTLMGSLYGTYRGYQAPIERAQEAINKMQRQQKVAGLFMRPSDIADHRNLASALEQKLNGADQGAQFKTAAGPLPRRMMKVAGAASLSTRAIDAGVGAVGGLVATNRLMNRVLADDSPIPPPQEPAGLIGRMRSGVLDSGTRSAREYPVTAHLLGAGMGALALHVGQPRIKERAYSLARKVG